ncbi:MAG: hypothetical protein LBG13_02930 [Holosporales bacterium]|jgi:SH3-like domain-containing protein|nr:hypothetical protein [Holosporales bacterium]
MSCFVRNLLPGLGSSLESSLVRGFVPSLLATALAFSSVTAVAAKQHIKSNSLAQCYFASVKVNEANLHNGPGKQYKIRCKYIKKGVPLLVTAQYEHWRKVKDADGTEGWIHKNLLSNIRYIVVSSEVAGFYESPDTAARRIAVIKQNVVARLLSVNKDWCSINLKHNGRTYTGWIEKKKIFGVGKNESW